MNAFNESRRHFLMQTGLGVASLTALPSIAKAMEGMGMKDNMMLCVVQYLGQYHILQKI